MAVTHGRHERLVIKSERDIVMVRHAVRSRSGALGFSLVDQTKIVTAASELARNTFVHGGGGSVLIEEVSNGIRYGLRLTFEDVGPGIPDIQQAMADGYSTAGGMGLGLGGAKRLSNEFEIISRLGEGTRVIISKWK